MLTVCERADYTKDGVYIALPLAQHCQTWEQCLAWKDLSDEVFMEKYGNAVLEQYHLPTDEEIARLEEFDGDDEEEEEGEGDDNDVYGYDNNND